MEDIQWTNIFQSLFKIFTTDSDKVEADIESVCAEDENILNTVSEDLYDDDDYEEIFNYKFMLECGTKILLHNTVVRLNRGKSYGLLSGNDSGKPTLMRSISNNQLEGFPDTSEVRTVFFE